MTDILIAMLLIAVAFEVPYWRNYRRLIVLLAQAGWLRLRIWRHQ